MSSKPKTVRQTLESIPKEENNNKKTTTRKQQQETTTRPRKAYKNKTILLNALGNIEDVKII